MTTERWVRLAAQCVVLVVAARGVGVLIGLAVEVARG